VLTILSHQEVYDKTTEINNSTVLKEVPDATRKVWFPPTARTSFLQTLGR